ncbi:GNAT family N-acetyltransferase [Spongorhabdus nitratireducens]
MKIITTETTLPWRQQLEALLCNCVDSGASIGFIAPLELEEAEAYWQSVDNELAEGARILLLAIDKDKVQGCVQLALSCKKNGIHRGEVEKLMVHTRARGQGIGRILMAALEEQALQYRRSLLVLDTRKGDIASGLYESLGYRFAGEIPDFALNSDGSYSPTLYYYKPI